MQLLQSSAAPSNTGQDGDTIIQTQNCVSPCARVKLIFSSHGEDGLSVVVPKHVTIRKQRGRTAEGNRCSVGESRVRLGIQFGTFVPLPQCEIFGQYKDRYKGCVENPTISPGREARDASFLRGRISATRKRLIGPRILEARKETGPAKSCASGLSRSKAVAAFCFLSCGESSSLPLRSKPHTILKVSAVLRVMEGVRKFLSQS